MDSDVDMFGVGGAIGLGIETTPFPFFDTDAEPDTDSDDFATSLLLDGLSSGKDVSF